MIQAKILTGLGKPKKTFCKSQWQINKKLVDNSITRKKSTKYARTIYVHFTSEIIQRVNTLLIYWRIMPSAERLSRKFLSCPGSFETSFPGIFIFPPQREQGKKDPGSGWSRVLVRNIIFMGGVTVFQNFVTFGICNIQTQPCFSSGKLGKLFFYCPAEL